MNKEIKNFNVEEIPYDFLERFFNFVYSNGNSADLLEEELEQLNTISIKIAMRLKGTNITREDLEYYRELLYANLLIEYFVRKNYVIRKEPFSLENCDNLDYEITEEGEKFFRLLKLLEQTEYVPKN